MDVDARRLRRYAELGEELADVASGSERRSIRAAIRAARAAFLDEHVGRVYDELTDRHRRAVRVGELVAAAGDRYPGLVPARDDMAAERERRLADKEGLEIDQALLAGAVLAAPEPGLHLVHAMLRPRPGSEELLPSFCATGSADLGLASVERRGAMGMVELRNVRFLNAEDDLATAALETAVDLVLLDHAIEVGVLRGSVVEHPRHAGHRVFNSGVNLTHLYHGKISLVDFFISRDLGMVAKLHRGLWLDDRVDECVERTREKPWIAAVDTHAIGGGCQLLLVMDRVLAERGAYFNLPARKEGIIPGAANLRLARFVGDRAARQAIMFERAFRAGEPDGALLCDEAVDGADMDAAIERNAEQLTSAGVVSAAANRKAMRVGTEPIDVFRRYMAMYCREQAACVSSPALVRNLERHWDAKRRRP